MRVATRLLLTVFATGVLQTAQAGVLLTNGDPTTAGIGAPFFVNPSGAPIIVADDFELDQLSVLESLNFQTVVPPGASSPQSLDVSYALYTDGGNAPGTELATGSVTGLTGVPGLFGGIQWTLDFLAPYTAPKGRYWVSLMVDVPTLIGLTGQFTELNPNTGANAVAQILTPITGPVNVPAGQWLPGVFGNQSVWLQVNGEIPVAPPAALLLLGLPGLLMLARSRRLRAGG